MPHESLAHVFMAHEMFCAMFSWKIHESLNEMVLFSWKIHGHEYSHGIYFVVFMGHEMPFMGFSLDIHGIFIQLCFIVIGDKRQNAKQTLKKADCQIVTARPCGLMFDPSPLKDNPTRLEIDKGRSVYTQPLPFSPYRPRQHPVENTLIA